MSFFTPIYLLAALSCPVPKIINSTPFPWNEFDAKTQERAEKRCSHHFPKSPCLIKLHKYAERDYRAMCGAKR